MAAVGKGRTGKLSMLLLGILIGLVALSPVAAAPNVTPKKAKKIATNKAKKVVNQEALVKPVAYRTSALTTVPDTELGFAFVLCPEGYVPTGGGYAMDFVDGVFVLVDAPTNADGSGPGTLGWAVYVGNLSGGDISFVVYVMCVKSNEVDTAGFVRAAGRSPAEWPEPGPFQAPGS